MRIAVNACHLGDDRHGLSRFTTTMLDALHLDNGKNSIRLLVPGRCAGPARTRYPRFMVNAGPDLPARDFSLDLLRHFPLDDTDLLWAPANVAPRERPACRLLVTLHDAIPALPFSRAVFQRPALLAMAAPAAYLGLRADCRRARQAACIATVSHHARTALLPLLRLAEQEVAVHLMPLEPRFRPLPSGTRVRTLRRLAVDFPYLLSIGGHARRKNLGRVLAAWASLPAAARHGRHLVVAAPPDARTAAAGRQAGDVHWLGHVADEALPALYGGADCLVFPSLTEGFGLPPLEAAACGTPSLVGNNGALAETATGTSLAVNPFSASEIADGMRRLLADARLRRRLAAGGEAVRRHHRLARAAAALNGLFRACVADPPGDFS